MPDVYLSETFFKIWLSLLLLELRHHQMLQTRWIILYTFIQRIANINQTGVLDNDTMTMMARPRCGIPDVTLGDMDINRFGGVDEDLPDTGCFLHVPDVTRSAHPLLMLIHCSCFVFCLTQSLIQSRMFVWFILEGNSVRKRYALYGTRWHQDKLSYCVVNYPRSQQTDPTPAERDAEKVLLSTA